MTDNTFLAPDAAPAASSRLLVLARERLRLKHCSIRTGQAYLRWIRRITLHHDKRDSREILWHPFAFAGGFAPARDSNARPLAGIVLVMVLASGLGHQLAQHKGQDAAVLVVVDFDGGVDPAEQGDFGLAAVGAVDAQGQVLLRA